ncbi:MAG: S1C family serine protease, partial [Planctomycetia bacterium]
AASPAVVPQPPPAASDRDRPPPVESGAVDALALLERTSHVFEDVARRVSPAVVYLEARIYDQAGEPASEESGSGVLVRAGGRDAPVVLTNYHVVAGAKPADVVIHLADGRRLAARKIWHDHETDVAVLDPGETDLPAAPLGDSRSMFVGQWVLAIGSPFGLSQSVTHGIISAKHRRQLGLPGNLRIKEFLQTDAAINPGNSGGPLVNLRGEVVGINTAIASSTGSSSGVGFSIPIHLVRWVADELLTQGKVRRGFLGVEFPEKFSFEKARAAGLPIPRGGLVVLVHADTPAALAGVKAGDVILSFDGTTVDDENHLINIVSQTPIAKPVELTVWRERREVKLQAVLGSWEDFRRRTQTAAPPAGPPKVLPAVAPFVVPAADGPTG